MHVINGIKALLNKNVQVGNNQEKAQSERNFHSQNQDGKN